MLKKLTKDTLFKFGYRLSRAHTPGVGADPFSDMQRLLGPKERPVIFDVGANEGQSIEWFKRVWPMATMHSFEPSPTTFEILKKNAAAYSDVHVCNAGLGKERGQLELIENTDSSMSSILEPGKYGWGELRGKTKVDVLTVDDYCVERGVNHVDLLKVDTQGYEYEVLQGAAKMLERKAVQLVYLELIFSEQYRNIVPADETIGLMRRAGYQLITIYDQFYQDDVLSWTDALFCNVEHLRSSRNGKRD
jgi:FkbM family methyltransferase